MLGFRNIKKQMLLVGIAQRYEYSIELLPLEACVNVVVDLRGGRWN